MGLVGSLKNASSSFHLHAITSW